MKPRIEANFTGLRQDNGWVALDPELTKREENNFVKDATRIF
jgi:hypothetical protein